MARSWESFSDLFDDALLVGVEKRLRLEAFAAPSDPQTRQFDDRIADGVVVFHPDSAQPLRVPAQFLGAANARPDGSYVWQWGWENPLGLPNSAILYARALRQLGEQSDIPLFTAQSIPVASWSMVEGYGFIASFLLRDCVPLTVYRGSAEAITSVEVALLQLPELAAAPPDARRIANAFAYADQLAGAGDWQRVLASYANYYGLEFETQPDPAGVRAVISGVEDGPVFFFFDGAGAPVAVEAMGDRVELSVLKQAEPEPEPGPELDILAQLHERVAELQTFEVASADLAAPEQSEPSPSAPRSWDSLFAEALLVGVEQRLLLADSHPEFEHFLKESRVVLNPDGPQTRAVAAQLIGVAFHEPDGSWVWDWGWQNPLGFPDNALTLAHELRAIGEREGFEPLLTRSIQLAAGSASAECYGMIAARLLPGHVPLAIDEGDRVTIALAAFELPEPVTASLVARTIAAATRETVLDTWVPALSSYADARGLEGFARPDAFVLRGAEGGQVTAVLDQALQIVAVESPDGRVELRGPSLPSKPAKPPASPPTTYPLGQELFDDVVLWSWEQHMRMEDIIGGESPYGNGPWWMDSQSGTITFNHGRQPSLTARAHFLGSASPAAGTWLPGWANTNGFPQHVIDASLRLRVHAESYEHDQLALPSLPLVGDPRDLAGRIGAYASFVLDLPYYTFDGGDGVIGLVLVEDDMFALREPSAFRITQILTRAIDSGLVKDWRRALRFYADKRDIGLTETGTGYLLRPAKGSPVEVKLDEHGRVASVKTLLDGGTG